jgi:hypothetical protein
VHGAVPLPEHAVEDAFYAVCSARTEHSRKLVLYLGPGEVFEDAIIHDKQGLEPDLLPRTTGYAITAVARN